MKNFKNILKLCFILSGKYLLNIFTIELMFVLADGQISGCCFDIKTLNVFGHCIIFDGINIYLSISWFSFFVIFSDRDRFQLGTLSHSLNSQANGYLELSDWPAVAPDQSVRTVEVVEPVRVPFIFKRLSSHNVKMPYVIKGHQHTVHS